MSIIVLWRCFNRRWVRSGGVRQKVLFRASLNCTFSFVGILAEAINKTHSGMLYRLEISTFYFYETLLFQIFVLWRFIKTCTFPCIITFTVNSHADNHFYKYIYLFILFIKIHAKVFYIQIWFKCETPLLFFQIKTMVYKKKPLYRKNQFFFCRLCKNYSITRWTHIESHAICNLGRWNNRGNNTNKKDQ